MNTTSATHLGMLLRCYEGLRNWRALAVLVAGFMAAAVLLVLDGVITAKLGYNHPGIAVVLGGALMLLAGLVGLAGINTTGLLLVDQADANPPRGFAAALFGGLGVTLQSIVCLIILTVGLVLIVLVLWGLSFLARIPGIGGMFGFLLAGPTMLVLASCYAVLVFGVALMFVALWRGHGIIGALGRAIDIVLKRPLDTVLHFIVLWLLIVPIELFVAAMLAGGATLTGAMYASGAYLQYMGDSPLGVLSGGGAVAASIGIVFAAVAALFALIALLGTVLIFDSLALTTDATSANFLRNRAETLKAEVEKHRPQAAAPQPAQPTPAVQTPPVAPAATPTPAAACCASCGALLIPGGRFCGECGTASG